MLIERAQAHDLAHVYDTWIKGYRDSPRTVRWPYDVYTVYQRAVIDRLLTRAQLVVARPDDWPEGIAGWLCAEQLPDRFLVHFAATKPHMRQQGILWRLVASLSPQGVYRFTHLRPPYSDTLKRRGYAHAALEPDDARYGLTKVMECAGIPSDTARAMIAAVRGNLKDQATHVRNS